MITTAGVAFREKDRKVFIAKRKAGKYLDECWEFPGGKVKGKEEPAEALKREFLEEFGITVHVGELFTSGEFWGNGKIYKLKAFWIEIEGEPVCREHLEMRWVPLEQVFRYEFPPSDNIVLGALRVFEEARLSK